MTSISEGGSFIREEGFLMELKLTPKKRNQGQAYYNLVQLVKRKAKNTSGENQNRPFVQHGFWIPRLQLCVIISRHEKFLVSCSHTQDSLG